MSTTISEELADNYRQLKAQRGCTWEQLARDLETGDPAIAAWFRSQSEPSKVQARTEPAAPGADAKPVKKAAPAKRAAPAKKAAPAKPKA
jgi:cyanate lyase